jgi:hypothetical protein
MNILEHMTFLNSVRAEIDREFAQDFSTVASAYHAQFYPGSETPKIDLEGDSELNRINQKWMVRFEKMKAAP